MNIIESSAKLTQWRLRLAEFYFDIKYKKGKGNKFYEAVFCLHTDGETEINEDDDIPSLHITRPTHKNVLNFDDDIPYYEELEKLPEFIERE